MSITSLKKRLSPLGIGGKWYIGIRLIDRSLPQFRGLERKELLVYLASFLYHDRFQKNLFNIRSDKNSRRAIQICRLAILDDPGMKNTWTLNARIFLAQMLAAGGDKEAIEIAHKTYDTKPSPLTANRLANTYEFLNKTQMAEKYYMIYEKLSSKDKKHLPYAYISIASFYRNVGNKKQVNKYLKKVKRLEVARHDGEIKTMLRVFTKKASDTRN